MHKVADVNLEFCFKDSDFWWSELKIENPLWISLDVRDWFKLDLLQILLKLILFDVVNFQALNFPKIVSKLQIWG